MISKAKQFLMFLKDIYDSRVLLVNLAKNDIKKRYAGSFFGIVWAFIQPLMTIFVLWFVFQMGFKSMPISDVPFILWLVAGYIPWFYFSDGLVSSAPCLMEYEFLVKKVRFRTSILPIVKVLSASIVHFFFIIFVFILFLINNAGIKLIYFQAFYYSFAAFILLIGIAWLVSAISVFIKDLTQVISVILQIGFWATPIFWNADNMSENVLYILKMNPMFYIVQGYRDSFIYSIPFYEHPWLTLYFWTLTFVVFCVGALTYQRLRPHFADVL